LDKDPARAAEENLSITRWFVSAKNA